jgi:hypothetical protein
MAKAKKRVATRKKSSKSRKAKTKTARKKKAAKRTASKKAKSKVRRGAKSAPKSGAKSAAKKNFRSKTAARKASKKAPMTETAEVAEIPFETTIIDVIEQLAPGEFVVTEYESVRTGTPTWPGRQPKRGGGPETEGQ